MPVRTRSVTTDDGDYIRIIEWVNETREYETVVVEYPMDNPEQFIVRAYENEEDKQAAYQTVFEMRDLSFSPVSIVGLGERDRLTGVSETESTNKYESIPRDVHLSLHSIGFTPVPRGTRWLDGV